VNMNLGHRIWVFPDGDAPPPEPYDPALRNDETRGHESLTILNAGDKRVHPVLHVYFTVQAPWIVALEGIDPERVVCLRLDTPLGDSKRVIPKGQYGLVLRCDHPVIAQFGRMDVRQPNLAYYTFMGHACD
jgi:hypothetical protein